MYKIEINSLNINASLKTFDKWLKDNHVNFIGFNVGDKITMYFNEDLTTIESDEIINYYNALTVTDVNPTDAIMPVYEQMQIDGKNYFFEAKAKYFGLKYYGGELTDVNINYCYNKLSNVAVMLNNGDWKPALYVLQNELNTIIQSDIDNGYTQEIHDNIINDINDYLSQ